MKQAFFIGCGISFILILTAFITRDYGLYGKVLLGFGIISVVISALLGGVFLSGPEIRANFHTESKEDRKRRNNTMLVTGIFALPNLVAAAFLLLI
ncbi:DUF5316 domain-containing protein [Oceanobacillus salinisoli]|uniref:DUF5316 domain-containing protein n=1 Tax=Oceanobacillus salinisoli TaxID=2678611 RepID=UPI0012E11A99|nr:DUF5316 domain-containing protein [Oceanobacillus salinisoli]